MKCSIIKDKVGVMRIRHKLQNRTHMTISKVLSMSYDHIAIDHYNNSNNAKIPKKCT